MRDLTESMLQLLREVGQRPSEYVVLWGSNRTANALVARKILGANEFTPSGKRIYRLRTRGRKILERLG